MTISNRSDRHQQWAVFWCSLLQPLLCGEIPGEEAADFLRKLTKEECLFPDGQRKKPSRSTLYRKWKQFRDGGFEGLLPKRRSDHGKPRKKRQAQIDKAVELKKDQPRRGVITINKFLEHEFQEKIPKSTLYRYLKRAGATRRKLGVSNQPVRRRWTRDRVNALWVGDFEDGPYVIDDDRARETHLSAFIDCHSRYVVEGRYYLRENFEVLIDSLLRAWSDHGASRELYVDNAGIYRAGRLHAACAELNIKLLHRKNGDPPGGGIIERFFETAQSQFEAEVRAGEILTLDKLKRAFTAWLEVGYHDEFHSEIRQTPRERFSGKRFTRHVDVHRAAKFFLKRVPRRVDGDFSDVQVNAKYFRVNEEFRTDKVEVRYDPYGHMENVLIYSLEGEYLATGIRHEREGDGQHSVPPRSPKKAKYNYLDLLIQQHQERNERQASGIDFQAALAVAQRRWPFSEFVKHLAQHLGYSGGLSAFRADQLETLQKVYQRLTSLTPDLLKTACAQAQDRSITEILFLLQHLHDQRSS